MHDTVWFEIQGIPSVFLASTEFVDAATAQSEMLGLPEVQRVFVPHPIQDATDAEMQAKAEEAFEAILGALID
ncbi:MAG: hypothetical protein HOH95_00520 [Dehalococcoidia bacterium]|nr:hypothetical protein [Dehalococcoidia bacterium]